LQIGDPSVIAQETRIPVVGDFRTADTAVGGQGAPLVPLLDYHMFRSGFRNRLVLNLGGIGNITSLPAGCTTSDVIAFDTGPANMVIDALAKRFLEKPFDRGGRFARAGRVVPDLLSWMMSIDYFRQPPPKSTGREMFGAGFVAELIRRGRGRPAQDLVATATEFTALSVYDQYVRFIRPSNRVDEVFVTGGGAHNSFLMKRLRAAFGPVSVGTIPDAGFSADAKEAVLFALLAYLTVLGRASNLPRVSGATRPVILGKICVP
jgi:anhydro-N-acetylmuramic acid kinase